MNKSSHKCLPNFQLEGLQSQKSLFGQSGFGSFATKKKYKLPCCFCISLRSTDLNKMHHYHITHLLSNAARDRP